MFLIYIFISVSFPLDSLTKLKIVFLTFNVRGGSSLCVQRVLAEKNQQPKKVPGKCKVCLVVNGAPRSSSLWQDKDSSASLWVFLNITLSLTRVQLWPQRTPHPQALYLEGGLAYCMFVAYQRP